MGRVFFARGMDVHKSTAAHAHTSQTEEANERKMQSYVCLKHFVLALSVCFVRCLRDYGVVRYLGPCLRKISVVSDAASGATLVAFVRAIQQMYNTPVLPYHLVIVDRARRLSPVSFLLSLVLVH